MIASKFCIRMNYYTADRCYTHSLFFAMRDMLQLHMLRLRDRLLKHGICEFHQFRSPPHFAMTFDLPDVLGSLT
jgi:hypothetical protein